MAHDFRARIFDIVAQIPCGCVMTYAAVARAVGHPRAARAVGNALNTNRDFVHIPCHRVVRSDGKIGGYVFGSEAKKALLRSEGIFFRDAKHLAKKHLTII